MSAILVALLAASPLVAAKVALLPRQTMMSAALPTCLLPPQSVLPTPTGAPELPSSISDYFENSYTNTDACGLSTLPPSIGTPFAAYTSSYSSWVSANLPALQSYVSGVSSYQSSIATVSSCSSYYTDDSDPAIITGASYGVNDFFPSDIFECTSRPSSGAVPTAPASSSATLTGTQTTGAAASSRASGPVSQSGTSSATPGFRAASAPEYFLYMGATVAVSAFVGMIAL